MGSLLGPTKCGVTHPLPRQGVLTIGYGHACQPASECNSIHAPITKAQGRDLLKSDAATFVSCVNKDVHVAVSRQSCLLSSKIGFFLFLFFGGGGLYDMKNASALLT